MHRDNFAFTAVKSMNGMAMDGHGFAPMATPVCSHQKSGGGGENASLISVHSLPKLSYVNRY
jgi:hypothetical protein